MAPAESSGDSPTHGKSALAKLRGLLLTLPPGRSDDFAFALVRGMDRLAIGPAIGRLSAFEQETG